MVNLAVVPVPQPRPQPGYTRKRTPSLAVEAPSTDESSDTTFAGAGVAQTVPVPRFSRLGPVTKHAFTWALPTLDPRPEPAIRRRSLATCCSSTSAIVWTHEHKARALQTLGWKNLPRRFRRSGGTARPRGSKPEAPGDRSTPLVVRCYPDPIAVTGRPCVARRSRRVVG